MEEEGEEIAIAAIIEMIAEIDIDHTRETKDLRKKTNALTVANSGTGLMNVEKLVGLEDSIQGKISSVIIVGKEDILKGIVKKEETQDQNQGQIQIEEEGDLEVEITQGVSLNLDQDRIQRKEQEEDMAQAQVERRNNEEESEILLLWYAIIDKEINMNLNEGTK